MEFTRGVPVRRVGTQWIPLDLCRIPLFVCLGKRRCPAYSRRQSVFHGRCPDYAKRGGAARDGTVPGAPRISRVCAPRQHNLCVRRRSAMEVEREAVRGCGPSGTTKTCDRPKRIFQGRLFEREWVVLKAFAEGLASRLQYRAARQGGDYLAQTKRLGERAFAGDTASQWHLPNNFAR